MPSPELSPFLHDGPREFVQLDEDVVELDGHLVHNFRYVRFGQKNALRKDLKSIFFSKYKLLYLVEIIIPFVTKVINSKDVINAGIFAQKVALLQ